MTDSTQQQPATSSEWGVLYDTHTDQVETLAANEARARLIYENNKNMGAVAVVRRQVTAWEVAE